MLLAGAGNPPAMPAKRAATSTRARLERYRSKRDFSVTPEPSGDRAGSAPPEPGHRFVVQRHRASRLHYDLRLEAAGVLLSWAVPKGPTLDPDVRRMAVHVEDHPLDYFDFEGVIPAGEYGGGDVIVWDWGTWELAEADDALEAVADGNLHFDLHGRKLSGRFALVRRGSQGDREQWLLIHKHDADAVAGWSPEDHPRSVKSGRTNDEVKSAPAATWSSDASWVGTDRRRDRRARRPPEVGRTVDVRRAHAEADEPRQGVDPGRAAPSGGHQARRDPPLRRASPRRCCRTCTTVRSTCTATRTGSTREGSGTRPGRRTPPTSSGRGATPTPIRARPRSTPCSTTRRRWRGRPTSVPSSSTRGRRRSNIRTARRGRMIDIDPGTSSSFDDVVTLAQLHRTALEHLGVEACPKVTGSRGIQIWIPVADRYAFDDTRRWVERLSRIIGDTVPELVSWRVGEVEARGARSTRLHPERDQQDPRRAVQRAAATRCAGVDADHVGRARRSGVAAGSMDHRDHR